MVITLSKPNRFSKFFSHILLGVVGLLHGFFFTIYSSFQRWKNFENRLGFDKVIAVSWVVHFLEYGVDDKIRR